MQIGEHLAGSPFMRAAPQALEHELRDWGLELGDAMARRMVGMAHDAAIVRASDAARRDASFRAAQASGRASARKR